MNKKYKAIYEAYNIIFDIKDIESNGGIVMTTSINHYNILKKLRMTISPFYFKPIKGKYGMGCSLLITNIKKNKDKITLYGTKKYMEMNR